MDRSLVQTKGNRSPTASSHVVGIIVARHAARSPYGRVAGIGAAVSPGPVHVLLQSVRARDYAPSAGRLRNRLPQWPFVRYAPTSNARQGVS